jgi:hypothetical protein
VFFCGVFSAILFTHTHTHTHTHICIQDHVPATKLQCNKFDQFRFSVNYGSVVQWVHKEHSIKKWNQLQASQRIEAMKERMRPKFWCGKWWRSRLKMLQGTNP